MGVCTCICVCVRVSERKTCGLHKCLCLPRAPRGTGVTSHTLMKGSPQWGQPRLQPRPNLTHPVPQCVCSSSLTHTHTHTPTHTHTHTHTHAHTHTHTH